MKTPVFTKSFERDKDRCIRRVWNMEKFKTLARLLLSDQPLPPNAKPHPLSGNFSGYTDCHVANDWVLIYKSTPTEIHFMRMGTHSDLF
jgi:mRNA interferase YafQ